MKQYIFGNPDANVVLIQPVDDHDLAWIEKETAAIAENSDTDFQLIAVKVHDWNKDLSPWEAPPVFGKESFGNGAGETLEKILEICTDPGRTYYIGGYSLAALFALWAACQTDVFRGVAAASPSAWFPGFTDYMKEHGLQTDAVYLSLGDKEEKTRNQVMATVGVRIREMHALLEERGVNCVLEWNKGNHFKDADLRTARAFAWIMNEQNR
ncbi:MAG: esterase [Firmicutes bacterium]|nr:esterase [Bacillota bacterium]